MKKLLYLGLVALAMLLALSGFTRAATPQLTLTGYANGKYGKYVPLVATLTVDGVAQENFEVYYATTGVTPSKGSYVAGEEENKGIYRVVASGTTAEIVLITETAPYFKAVAYPAGTSTASNTISADLTALAVEKPEFNPPLPQFGKEVVDVNTVIRITDNAGGAEIYYTTDGETNPLKSLWEKNDPRVFKYDDATGIKITHSMTIWAIAFKEVNGMWAGSEKLRKGFDLSKPTIILAFKPSIYTIREETPVVDLFIPEGVTLGTRPGDAAIMLTCEDVKLTQYITANGQELDVSKANRNNREDEWTIRAALVKGDNFSQPFSDEVGLTPEVISMEILKKGERPAKPVFSVPSGQVYRGTVVEITCATPGATIYYTDKDGDINTVYRGPLTINSDVAYRAYSEKDGISSFRDGVSSVYYTVVDDPMWTLTATASPASGSQIAEKTEITITPSMEVDQILFKLYEKAEAIAKDNNFLTTATEYSETVKPVPTEEKPVVHVGLSKNGTWKYFNFAYTFLPGVPRPVFTPASGAVPEGTEVEITLEREGVEATIYYTTNDSVPQVGKPFTNTYTEKIVVNQAMTINAIAVTQEGESSKMTSAFYTIKPSTPDVPKDTVKTPVFSMASGKVKKGTKIGLSCATPGAVIYYAFGGDEPTTDSEVYGDSIEIETVTTLKAIAVKDGWVDSKVAEVTYLVMAAPTPGIALGFTPPSGSTVDAGTSITIGMGGARDVFYMMYGSLEEAQAAEWDQDQASSYNSEMLPAVSEARNTIKAAYSMDGDLLADTFFYATYIVKKPQPVELTFLPASGSAVEDSTEIVISANTDDDVLIYYKVYADSMASVEDVEFFQTNHEVSEDGNPVITQGNTFLKCGVYDKSIAGMRYFYASYTIKEKIDAVEKPTFSLLSGLVTKGTKVAISCATEDARIYYTLDGEEPTLISLPYSDSIVIDESIILKAIAFKAGMAKSDVAVAYYTLRSVDNETEELAGVRIYPNPNNGQFRISVPVDAQAEVFTVGGQLVERVALSAGANTLRIENSGAYLVRVRANGQVAIRKVFVY